MITREALYSAFFSQAQAAALAAGVVSTGRRFKLWTDVPPEQQPALFQVQKDEEPYEQRGRPTRWYLKLQLFLYINVGEDPVTPQTPVLNPIIDAIEAAFPINRATGFQQLTAPWESQGGRGAYNVCWEKVEYFEDVLGGTTGQAVAVIDVRITSA